MGDFLGKTVATETVMIHRTDLEGFLRLLVDLATIRIGAGAAARIGSDARVSRCVENIFDRRGTRKHHGRAGSVCE